MQFTYDSYIGLIRLLQEMDYTIASYDNYKNYDKCVILRHDVDYRLRNACELAEFEQLEDVRSTFFLLLTSDFYNVFSLDSKRAIDRIMKCGHEIGLHFDEVRYPQKMGDTNFIRNKILEEADILSKAIGTSITKVSMHRPSRQIIDSDMQIPGMINTNSYTFFKDIKYVSDSRHIWREPVEDIIRSKQYNRIQIVVHPFWYDKDELDIKEAVCTFINSANAERYQIMNKNISDLSEIMETSQIDSQEFPIKSY